MIHGFIDAKKKTVKNKNGKTLNDKAVFENPSNCQPSDSIENQDVHTLSSTFIPPWLRNSLGLNQWHNQCLANNDRKTLRITPKPKDQENGELESRDSSKKRTEQLRNNDKKVITGKNVTDVYDSSRNHSEKSFATLWTNTQKQNQVARKAADLNIASKAESNTTTTTDGSDSIDSEKAKQEERKRGIIAKQQGKLKKWDAREGKSEAAEKKEIDQLLNDHKKRSVHSVASDVKQLEAKLISLSDKIRKEDLSKLNKQEVRLLRELQEQIGSNESVSKMLDQIKKLHMKELRESSRRVVSERKGNTDEEMSPRVFEKVALHKGDDENNVNRFSEFLSANKNMEDKRKCLEEVKNYFENKRRTRLTKRGLLIERKQKSFDDADKKESEKEKQKSLIPAKSKKGKYVIREDEIVEKAVNETLQKFIDLYHFRVSPSVLNSMRRNILQAIQSDSLASSKTSNVDYESHDVGGISPAFSLTALGEGVDDKNKKILAGGENFGNKDPLPGKKESKANVEVTRKEEKLSVCGKENDVMENEHVKKLKKEFDVFCTLVKSDVTHLELVQLVAKKKTESSQTQSVIYSFSSKSFDFPKTDLDSEPKTLFDKEIQAACNLNGFQRHVKVQAMRTLTRDQGLQTIEKTYQTSEIQTENNDANMMEVMELKNCDISTGLFRMVKSNETKKFYLYPENAVEAKIVCNCTSPLFNTDFEEISLKGKVKKRKKVLSWKKKKPHRFYKKISSYNMDQKKWGRKSKNSLSCLYFKNHLCTTSDAIACSSTTIDEKDRSEKEIRVKPNKDENTETVWLWNGEKISPGSDLKTHVEELLMKKLKEIENQNARIEFLAKADKSEKGKEESDVNDDQTYIDDTNNVTEVRKEEEEILRTATPSVVLVKQEEVDYYSQINEVKTSETNKSLKTKDTVDSGISEVNGKLMKDVGIQNSNFIRETFLLLHSSGNDTESFKYTEDASKRDVQNINVDLEEEFIDYKKAAETLKRLLTSRDVKSELNSPSNDMNNSEESFTMEEETPISTSTINSGEDITPLLLAIKKYYDDTQPTLTEKKKVKKDVGLVECEVQTNLDKHSSVSFFEKSAENQMYCNLIEKILDSVSEKEKGVLWKDVKELLKNKMKQDGAREGHHEVCIEIEQNMIKNMEDETKPRVFAKGYYNKDGGDVEIEIDLTLNDLERVLRHRQLKIKRRQVLRSLGGQMKFFPGLSIGALRRAKLKRYHKYLENLSGSSVLHK